MSFEYLADQMVARLARMGISDERVLEAFRVVPRHHFVETALQDRSYGSHPLPIGEGQTISQPYIQAISLQLLELEPHMHALEVGAGSGYQTALLAELVDDVCAIEMHPSLLRRARERLDELRYTKVRLRLGDGSQGWEQFAPYDAIVVAAVAPSIPEPLYQQLREGGRMVLPVEDGGIQYLVRVTKTPEGPLVEDKGECRFVPLVGEHGYDA